MKKIIITILLFSVLVSIFSLTKITRGYDNLPTICFDGKQKEILFINDNKGDLFNNLKELMPGDKKQQDIILKLENIKFDTKLYLKINNKNNELPLGVSIKLYKNDNELKPINGLIDLGTFTKDEEMILKVLVEVPSEVGNEIQDLKYNINWEIFIQENDENDDTDINENNTIDNITNNSDSSSEISEDELVEVPYTYDNSNINIYIIICIISFIIMIIAIIALVKENTKIKRRKN